MKFFHISDLHFGKMLGTVSLIENDQPYWVEQFLLAVDKHQPDAVVISGDIYDRRVPSPEAMKLFDHLITELAYRNKYVFIIPGNHDSSVRLAHVNELLTTHKIYIAGDLQQKLMQITVPGETVNVTFWLLPFFFPKLVSSNQVLNRDDLSSYDEAARALLVSQNIDTKNCNVLIAHQYVLDNGTAPEFSGSETVVGGLGEIDYSAFDAFDYVALGHIHNAQKVGRETVRYSGCPLYYDFSEINRKKSLTLVTINSKNKIEIEQIEIPILHKLLQKIGTFDELRNDGYALENKEQFYIQCKLTDKHVPPHAIDQLKAVYGSQLINVIPYTSEINPSSPNPSQNADFITRDMEEQFRLFFQNQTNNFLDNVQEELIQIIVEQQSRQGGDYFLDVKSIPEEDSQELLDFLSRLTMEDKE